MNLPRPTHSPEGEPGGDGAPRENHGLLDPILSDSSGGLWGLQEEGDPESSARAGRNGDPWAHRRGEPRVFVLLWSLYLFGAALLTLFRVPTIGSHEPRFVQDAVRMLLVLVVVGLLVLWPMTRLSQAPARRPFMAVWVDLLALLLPLQTVLWPLTVLGRWKWSVTGGVAVMLCGWALLVGALVAGGSRRPVSPARTWWMAACLLLVASAPGWAALSALLGVPTPYELALASPLTGVIAVTTAESGLSPEMTPRLWAWCIAPCVAGALAWLVLGCWSALTRDTPP